MKFKVFETLTEEISDQSREQISIAKPNDIITVYHGTIISRLPDLINGFDATSEHRRDYRSGTHKGLFVTPDFDVARSFGGGAIVEIKVKAKYIHGTDYSGNIGREQEAQGTALTWIKKQFPNSFRPYMAYTMLQSVEPQGLLRGLVKPSQITKIWVKNVETKTWDEYSREEYLSKEKPNRWNRGKPDRRFKDAKIDLSSPKIKLKDFFRAYAVATGNEDREERLYKIYSTIAAAPNGKERIKNMVNDINIGGSYLGPLAKKSIVKQVMELPDKVIGEEVAIKASLPTLLEYLFEMAETMTDKRIQKIQDDWVNNNVKGSSEIFWFPPKELFKYREYMRRTRPDLQKSMRRRGFDPKYPLLMGVGKNGVTMVGEGNHRLKTAIQLGIPFVPVKFYFQQMVEKTPIKNSEATQM